jgi:hypothetical protein
LIGNIANLVILNNYPYLALVFVVIMFSVFSMLSKQLRIVLRFFAVFFWIIQFIWQICWGCTIQELIIVWAVELLVFWFTTKKPSKITTQNKDNLVPPNFNEEDEKSLESILNKKEDEK